MQAPLESSLPANIDRDVRSKCAYNKAKMKPNCTDQKLICGHRVVEYALGRCHGHRMWNTHLQLPLLCLLAHGATRC